VTLVDFYILKEASDDARLKLTCRIVDKAVASNQHVFICPSSKLEAQQLDELLWTFSPGSFLPHRIITQDCAAVPEEPVLIAGGGAPMGERWDLLINLADEVPEYFSRYAQVAEVVDAGAERRALGRERYKFYRDRGYSLNTHQV
jgi:DNA polymerase III subunit chi